MSESDRYILIVEDNPQDEKIAVRSLTKRNLANRIGVARGDGAERRFGIPSEQVPPRFARVPAHGQVRGRAGRAAEHGAGGALGRGRAWPDGLVINSVSNAPSMPSEPSGFDEPKRHCTQIARG